MMETQTCCLEAQENVRLNWKEQFRLRSSLLKTSDGVTLVGTEVCRHCGATWYYDGRPPSGQPLATMDRHVYWYTPATPAMIERCDTVERGLADRQDSAGAEAARALDALDDLDAAMQTARRPRPWLRLVDQGPGAEWAAIGTWQPRATDQA